MPRVSVSAIITTFNEIDFIEDCIRSVEWADEIYLIDSFSTHGTVELIRHKFPLVRLEHREYPGAAPQKNYPINPAPHHPTFYTPPVHPPTPHPRHPLLRT